LDNGRSAAQPRPRISIRREAAEYRSLGRRTRPVHHITQFAHRGIETHEEGTAHDGVSDVELLDLGDESDGQDIADREPVACVDGEPEFRAQFGSVPERDERRAVGGVVGIGASMQLDRAGAGVGRRAYHALVRVDEEAGADAGSAQARDTTGKPFHVLRYVQSALGRDFLPTFGNEAHLVRRQPLGDREHLVRERHLEVEHRANRFRESIDVVVLDVAPIFAQMRGDAVRAGVLTDARRSHGIGLGTASCLPHGRDMVDVDVEPLAPYRSLCCCHFQHPLWFANRRGSRWGARVKKLAIVVLLVVAGCSRMIKVSGPTGAPSALGAVEMFFAAAKAQDYQAFGRAWGSAKGSVLANTERKAQVQLEQREFILMKCLRHDRYQVLAEAASANGERVLTIEMHLKDVTASSNFTVVLGPGARWYVLGFEPKDVQSICVAK